MFAFFFVLRRKNECLTCAQLDLISSSNIEGVRTINLNKVWHQFVIIISVITMLSVKLLTSHVNRALDTRYYGLEKIYLI